MTANWPPRAGSTATALPRRRGRVLLNKQIADRLDVQERTVKAHLSAIFERLGVRNRTQAGVVLRELELSDPSRLIEG